MNLFSEVNKVGNLYFFRRGISGILKGRVSWLRVIVSSGGVGI